MRCLWIGLLVLLLAGCGVGSSLTDFTAYYNTFYNAQRAFDEGTAALASIDEPVDPERYLALFPGSEHIQQPEPLEQAIEKSADVLRDHPGSRWVDPALMLIGQSYFYLENLGGAEQNFREVIERGSGDVDAARVWLARTLVEAGHYDRAAEHLQESLSRADSERARARLRLVQGELRVRQQDWSGAADALARGLEGPLQRPVRARASFLLGQVRETEEVYDRAYEAYEAAYEQRPRYELAFAAQRGMIRAQSRSGDLEGALARLQRMEQRSAHRAKRPELAYLRGRIYQEHGRVDVAEETFRQLLRTGEEAPLGDVEGRVHYALGELYRDGDPDFVRASAHFDSAATTLGSPGDDEMSPRLPRTRLAFRDAPRQADRFRDVARATQRVERIDSLLALGTLDDEAFEVFVEELRRERLQELQQARRAEQERQQSQFGSAAGLEGIGGAAQTAASAMGEAGFLFHRAPSRVQENRARFIQRWGQRPRVPNWRRQNALSELGGTAALGEEPPADEPLEESVRAELTIDGVEVDLSEVPRDPASREAMLRERAEARYELANALFLSVERPDSAAVWYRRVIEEGGETPVTLRAHYALGELYHSIGREEEARQQYRIVADRGERPELVARARQRLQEEASPASDQQRPGEDRSEAAYAQAYAAWKSGLLAEAFGSMVAAAAAFPDRPAAPRALLAAGQIGLEWAAREGRPRRARLPAALPDSLRSPGAILVPPTDTLEEARAESGGMRAEQPLRALVERYPDTPHAERARPLLAALEEEPLPADEPRPIAAEEEERPPRRTPAEGAEEEAVVAEEQENEPPAAAPATEPLSLQSGDWTVIVSSEPSRPAAEAIAEQYRADGFRVGVIAAEGGGEVRYRVAVDRFESQEDGLTALEDETTLPDDAWLYRLPPAPAGVPLVVTERFEPGDWTIVVASAPSRNAAEEIAERYRSEGFSAAVLPIELEGEVRYRIVLEQFEAQEAGRAALEEETVLPDDAWLYRLPLSSSDSPTAAAEEPPSEEEEEEPPAVARPSTTEPLALQRGDWTIVVASEPSRADAEAIAERYRSDGFRSGVLSAEAAGEMRYRVAVQQFDTQEDGLRALEEEVALPEGAWLYRLPPAQPEASAAERGEDATPLPADVDTPAFVYGEAPLDWEQGGWTLVVASFPALEEAHARAEGLRDEGFRADVLSAVMDGDERHRVVVGRFPTRAQALAARDQLLGVFPAGSWLLNLPPERN